MLLFHIHTMLSMSLAACAWKVQWYAGFTNCTIPTSPLPGPPFVVRVWESGTDSSACVARDPTTTHPLPGDVHCQDRSYNNTDGTLVGTKACTAEIGRGSIKVVEGWCRFWDDISGDETCSVGAPYLGLRSGQCEDEGFFEGFRCAPMPSTCPGGDTR